MNEYARGILGLLNPDWARRVAEQERQAERKRCVLECPNAKTFLYINHVLPKSHPLSTRQGKRHGVVYFSDDVVCPVLCELLPGRDMPEIWMGVTPMECLTQRQGIRLAKGRVVVGGLGLGWFLNEVCKKPSVERVVVVEKNGALLDWLKHVLMEKYPAVRAKVGDCWVRDDVYNYMESVTVFQRETRYLLDIWSSFGGCDRKFYEWRKKLAPNQLWGWGDVSY
jgi:hypothetical protein